MSIVQFGVRWESDGSVNCPKCARKHTHEEIRKRFFYDVPSDNEFRLVCHNEECEHEMQIQVESEPHFGLVMEPRP